MRGKEPRPGEEGGWGPGLLGPREEGLGAWIPGSDGGVTQEGTRPLGCR